MRELIIGDRNIFGNYTGDVLILHGDRDDVVPYIYSEKAAKVYKNAKLIKMEGKGHGFTPEGGKKAMNIVSDFLNRLSIYTEEKE